MRFVALSIVVLACLVAPGRAAAHSRAPTVALDYRLELSRATLPGVHAQVVDGDRALRIRVDPPHRLLVLGLLGLGLGSLSVFRHRVVISSLPASIARLVTAVALLGGAAAIVLAVLTPTDSRVRR